MKYETKFDLGDHVWGVSDQEFYRIVRCKPCGNTGKVVIGEESLICPKCNGKSTHREYVGRKFYVSTFDAVVGMVRTEHTDETYRHAYNREEANPKIEYMVSSTGVGSGQVWRENQLFESEKDAQTYCDHRNGLLPSDEIEDGKDIIGRFGEVLGV